MLPSVPYSINWNFTDMCSFNCRHCYSRGRPAKQEMSDDDYVKIAEKISNSGVFYVNFGGGEPILARRALELCTRILSEKGVSTFVSTTGWKLTEELLLSLKDKGLKGFFFSIDSLNSDIHDYIRNQKGCLEKTKLALKMAVDNKMFTGLSTVVSKFNWKEIPQILDFAVASGCNAVSLKRFRPVGNGLKNDKDFSLEGEKESEMLALMKFVKEKYSSKLDLSFVYRDFPIQGFAEGCPCGVKSLGLMPNGDVKMCVYGFKVIGNLLKDDLSDIWLNDPYLKQNRIHHVCEGMNDERRSNKNEDK